MEKINNKLVVFTAIILVILACSVIGFIFWQPAPEYIQGEVEGTFIRVSGKLPGRIQDFKVEEGDIVEKGDTLAILYSPEVYAKMTQAEGASMAAKALGEKANKGLRSEQITMAYETWQKAKAGLVIAEKSYKRVKSLFEKEVISEQKYDETKAKYDMMVATEKTAKAQYQMAKEGARKEDKEAAKAQIMRAKGIVEEVASFMSETIILAPTSGKITEIYYHEGELVGSGSPIMDVMENGKKKIIFNVREDLLKDFKEGDVINVEIPALNMLKTKVKITHIKDMGSYATWKATKTSGRYDQKTFEVKALPIENIEGIIPGMSVLKRHE